MKSARKMWIAGLLTATSLAIASSSLHAQVVAETSDAGQTLPTAQATGAVSGLPLTTITGTFNSITDADLYVITITAPSTFSATTVNAATNLGGEDTALFLFDANGTPIATNDDANGTTTDSTLQAGNSLYSNLLAGRYFLAISESGNEPVNSAGQLLFKGYPSGDTTATRGAATSLNPATEANFNGNTFYGEAGAYEIDLTSAATAAAAPEPSTWAAIAFGGVATAFTFLRRRRTI